MKEDDEKKTALHYAAMKGHLDVVKTICIHSRNPDSLLCTVDNKKLTALNCAALKTHYDIVKYLLHPQIIKSLDSFSPVKRRRR